MWGHCRVPSIPESLTEHPVYWENGSEVKDGPVLGLPDVCVRACVRITELQSHIQLWEAPGTANEKS